MFFTKYTLFAEKNNIIWEKKLIFFCLLKKAFFTENEKDISHLRNIFLSRKYILKIYTHILNIYTHQKKFI